MVAPLLALRLAAASGVAAAAIVRRRPWSPPSAARLRCLASAAAAPPAGTGDAAGLPPPNYAKERLKLNDPTLFRQQVRSAPPRPSIPAAALGVGRHWPPSRRSPPS